MFNAFSFCLIKKKQKIKAARILLKSVSVELKGLKLAALRQQPLLNVHTPRFLNVKFMRPVFLVLGRAAVVEHVAVASLGFWVRLGFAIVFSPGSIGRLFPIIMGDFICYYWKMQYFFIYVEVIRYFNINEGTIVTFNQKVFFEENGLKLK